MKWNKFTLKTRSEVEDIVISSGRCGNRRRGNSGQTAFDRERQTADVRGYHAGYSG